MRQEQDVLAAVVEMMRGTGDLLDYAHGFRPVAVCLAT